MLKSLLFLDCLLFEGVNVGWGKGVFIVWVGDIYKEGNFVMIVGLIVWYINEYRYFELLVVNYGYFYLGK